MKDSAIRMNAAMASELKALDNRADNQIDFSDIPEMLDWNNAMVGKFYRPIKQPVSLRVDIDVLIWFKSLGKKYQSRMNAALRKYMEEHHNIERKA